MKNEKKQLIFISFMLVSVIIGMAFLSWSIYDLITLKLEGNQIFKITTGFDVFFKMFFEAMLSALFFIATLVLGFLARSKCW